MSSRPKKAAVALTGAMALASGAYALGSQSGDGSASASDPGAAGLASVADRDGDRGRRGHHRPFELSGLADRLGVSESKLRAALTELRSEKPAGERQEQLAADLADALGLPAGKVEDALGRVAKKREAQHQKREDAFAASLAKALGIDEAKVRSTLDDLRGGQQPGPGFHKRGDRPSLSDLAKKLGVDESKLQAALEKVRPGGEMRREHFRRPGPDGMPADLAKELGVSASKLRAAFDKLRSKQDGRFRDRRAEFAKALAKKLDIPLDRVQKALPARPPGPPPGGPGFHP